MVSNRGINNPRIEDRRLLLSKSNTNYRLEVCKEIKVPDENGIDHVYTGY